jgi:uncharacterized protein YlxP (DUF503 family)
VSVAETAFQNMHQRAQLTAVLVTPDGKLAESVLDKIDGFVDERGGAPILSVRRGIY